MIVSIESESCSCRDTLHEILSTGYNNNGFFWVDVS
jgi:hypothetical protein